MAESFEPFREPGGQFLKLVGSPLAGATIAPTAKYHHINNTTAISTITPPYAEFEGEIGLIADSQFTITTSGNVALPVTTTVVGRVFGMVYDKTQGKWYPRVQS